ncbi:MAG: PEGA domain-containing protein [Pseudomonadota bacterium]
MNLDNVRTDNVPIDIMSGLPVGDRDNKTIINSFLCADIVEYSKDTIAGQIGLKEYFNSVLGSAISEIPVQDRIIIDTGDGAVISFLGEVEGALRTALNIRSRLLDAGMGAPLQIRMGINLGPVRLVKDINGHPNIVGDGINVAQRLMGFANEGQILVSRSYFEAVSRLSPEYAELFRHIGLLTDKHVRTHDVYAVLGRQREITSAREKLGGLMAVERVLDRGEVRQLSSSIKTVWRKYQSASMPQRMLYAGVTAGGIALLIVMAIYLKQSAVHGEPAVEADKPAAQSPSVAALPAAPQVSAEAPAVSSPAIGRAVVEKRSIPPPAAVAHQARHATVVSVLQSTKTISASLPPSAAAVPETAEVYFAVTPWGEIHLDGKVIGISPPLTELQMGPGTHEIRISNTTFPAYTQQIRVKANDKIKIKHKFEN